LNSSNSEAYYKCFETGNPEICMANWLLVGAEESKFSRKENRK